MAERSSNSRVKKIAIIGPECTGKTTLAQQLALKYNTRWVPEFAREYVLNLPNHYTYNDLEFIAKTQLKQIHEFYDQANNFVFFDTELIITKVWFDVVYKNAPDWINEAILNSGFEMYLLCNTELPWEPDDVRENGGEMRETLYKIYRNELISRNFKFDIVTGNLNDRLQNAKSILEKNLEI